MDAGAARAFKATAFGSTGDPAAGVTVTFDVRGANPATYTALTAGDGSATVTHTGVNVGVDTFSVLATINGNLTSGGTMAARWNWVPPPPVVPGPGPTITGLTPADGPVITDAVNVDATITAPPGGWITALSVTARPVGTDAGDPQQRVLPWAGVGFGRFDPTVISNGQWVLTASATDSNNDTTTVETILIVDGKAGSTGRCNPPTLTETGTDRGTMTFGYDFEDRRTTETDAIGRVVSITLDPLGRTTTENWQTAGLVTIAGYNPDGEMVTVTNPAGETTSYGYDPAGNQTSATDPLGHTTTTTYDSRSLPTMRADALGRATTSTYGPAARMIRQTTASGTESTFGYDRRGNQTSMTDGLGNTDHRTYDAVGNLTTMTDARGFTTSYTHDAANQQIQITDPIGGTASFGYDPGGRQNRVTDPNGGDRTRIFNRAGDPFYESDALGRVTEHRYDQAGRRTAWLPARGFPTAY